VKIKTLAFHAKFAEGIARRERRGDLKFQIPITACLPTYKCLWSLREKQDARISRKVRRGIVVKRTELNECAYLKHIDKYFILLVSQCDTQANWPKLVAIPLPSLDLSRINYCDV